MGTLGIASPGNRQNIRVTEASQKFLVTDALFPTEVSYFLLIFACCVDDC